MKWGMVKLTPDQQEHFVAEAPEIFVPENGAWGLQGCTAVRLDTADPELLGEAMTLAWRNTVEKSGPASRRRNTSKRSTRRSAKRRG
jgi:hypothetical protein